MEVENPETSLHSSGFSNYGLIINYNNIFYIIILLLIEQIKRFIATTFSLKFKTVSEYFSASERAVQN